MEIPHHADHAEPTRAQSAAFFAKSRLLIGWRWCRDARRPVRRQPKADTLRGCRPAGSAGSALWTQISPAEFPLTAGKVQNLRAACRILDGVEVPAGEIFGFWKQLGRTTRQAGFTEGRELRSGCMVPALGGGLCQLSGLMHAAALAAGLEILERHAHSRTPPGGPMPDELDATIFWNYVDLRFRAPFAWRLETRLTATDLVVTIRQAGGAPPVAPREMESGRPARAAAEGDCLTCGVTSCFRHPSANRERGEAHGHTAWLLESCWPEFDAWCRKHTHPGDRWQTPLDGRRWRKPNYAWTPPDGAEIRHATWETLRRSWHQRRLPLQGAARQNFLLDAQRRLAADFAKRLDPAARHLVISQSLLPHLWQAGHLGGRTFDVLLSRWPLAELHARLDEAFSRHPESDTLADFRADSQLVEAEAEALAAAARVVTPHRALAAGFGLRAILLDWTMQAAQPLRPPPAGTPKWFFPASPLGRKGIHEIASAVLETGGELLILGHASEGGVGALGKIPHRHAAAGELADCAALVLPAWIEHEPRLALRALAMGIPVIASRACGLPRHDLLTETDAGDAAALAAAMRRRLAAVPA